MNPAAKESAAVHLPPSRSSPTRLRYIVLCFLCVLAFLTYFDRVCIASAQGDIKRDLGMSDAAMCLVFGAFWLAYGLFEIPGGWMGDRFGSRRTLTRIVLAWSLFTALSGSAIGFVSLLTYRFLFGAGEAGAYPNMASVQRHWFSAKVQGRMGGILWLVSRWGGAASFVAFPALLSLIDRPRVRHALANIGLQSTPAWRIGFWTCGVVGLAWVALFYPWFRDDPAEQPAVNAAELRIIRGDRPAAQIKVQHDTHIFRALFSAPSLWFIAIGYLGTSFGWSFFVSWMPKYMATAHPTTPAVASLLNTGPLLFGGVACLLGGWASDLVVRTTGRQRFGRVIFPICGAATAALAMLAIPFAHSAQQAAGLLCLASFGSDIGQAPAWASIIGIGGEYAGTAFGFINMIANVGGNFLQPVIGQWVFHHLGWPALFIVYTGAFATTSLMWMRVDPTRRFYRDLPHDPRGFEVVPASH